MFKNLVVIIPSRGNSKGIKNKNIGVYNGKKLIDYSIFFAKKLKPSSIILSSESDKILSYCKKFKIKLSKRNKELSKDNVHSINVVMDIIKNYKINNEMFICMLLPTYPLREFKKFKFFR